MAFFDPLKNLFKPKLPSTYKYTTSSSGNVTTQSSFKGAADTSGGNKGDITKPGTIVSDGRGGTKIVYPPINTVSVFIPEAFTIGGGGDVITYDRSGSSDNISTTTYPTVITPTYDYLTFFTGGQGQSRVDTAPTTTTPTTRYRVPDTQTYDLPTSSAFNLNANLLTGTGIGVGQRDTFMSGTVEPVLNTQTVGVAGYSYKYPSQTKEQQTQTYTRELVSSGISGARRNTEYLFDKIVGGAKYVASIDYPNIVSKASSTVGDVFSGSYNYGAKLRNEPTTSFAGADFSQFDRELISNPEGYSYQQKSDIGKTIDYTGELTSAFVSDIGPNVSSVGGKIGQGGLLVADTIKYGIGGQGSTTEIRNINIKNSEINRDNQDIITELNILERSNIEKTTDASGAVTKQTWIGNDSDLKKYNNLVKRLDKNYKILNLNRRVLDKYESSKYTWFTEDPTVKSISGTTEKFIKGDISTMDIDKLSQELGGLSEFEAYNEGKIPRYGYMTKEQLKNLSSTKLTPEQWKVKLQEIKNRADIFNYETLTATAATVFPVYGLWSPIGTKTKQFVGYELGKKISDEYINTEFARSLGDSGKFSTSFTTAAIIGQTSKYAGGGVGPWLGLDIGKAAIEDPYGLYESVANKERLQYETIPSVLGFGFGEKVGELQRNIEGRSGVEYSTAIKNLETQIKNKKIDLVDKGTIEQTLVPGSRKIVFEKGVKATQRESNLAFEKDFIKYEQGRITQAEMDYAIKEIRQGKYPTIIKDAYLLILKEAQGLTKLKPEVRKVALRQIEWTGKYGPNIKDGVVRYSQGGGVGKTGVQPRVLMKMNQLIKIQKATYGGSIVQTTWRALKQFAGDLDLFVKNPVKSAKEMHALLVKYKVEKSIQADFKIKEIVREEGKIYAKGFKEGETLKLVEYHFENMPLLARVIPDLSFIKADTSSPSKIVLKKGKVWSDLFGMEDTLSRTAFDFAERPIITQGGEKIVTPKEQYFRTIVGSLEGRAGKDIPKLTQMRERYYEEKGTTQPFIIDFVKTKKTEVQPWNVRLGVAPEPIKVETITRKPTVKDITQTEKLLAREIARQQTITYKSIYTTPKYKSAYTAPKYKTKYYQDKYYQAPYYQQDYYQKPYYQEPYYQKPYYNKGYYQGDYYQSPYYQKGYYQKGYYQKPYEQKPKMTPPSKKDYDIKDKKSKLKQQKYFTRYSASLGGLLQGGTKKPKTITGVERRGGKIDVSKQIRKLTGL